MFTRIGNLGILRKGPFIKDVINFLRFLITIRYFLEYIIRWVYVKIVDGKIYTYKHKTKMLGKVTRLNFKSLKTSFYLLRRYEVQSRNGVQSGVLATLTNRRDKKDAQGFLFECQKYNCQKCIL